MTRTVTSPLLPDPEPDLDGPGLQLATYAHAIEAIRKLLDINPKRLRQIATDQARYDTLGPILNPTAWNANHKDVSASSRILEALLKARGTIEAEISNATTIRETLERIERQQ